MTRRLMVWLAGGVVLLTVFALVGCVLTTTVAPVKATGHPGYVAGTACDAAKCHDTYKHKEPYLGPCENCHGLDRWKPAVYSHEDPTFDNGMHPLIGCAMCHVEGEPLPSPECSSCHTAPHEGSSTCGNCHGTNAWGMRKPLPGDHVSLEGGHSTLSCFECHEAGPAPKTARTCTSCHGTNHGGLKKCETCHDPARGWEPTPGWSHDGFFKITGQHKKLECTQCHKNGKFPGTPKVCVGCHGKKHGGLTNCAKCHTTAGFKPSSFRHSSVFRLTGRHADLACTKCHYKRQYAKVLGNGSHACVSCHGTKHGGLTDCARCHTTAGFGIVDFTHPSSFPLTGGHRNVGCTRCHPSLVFTPPPSTNCANCHAGDSNHGSNVPPCQQCHTPTGGWNSASFNHPGSFPLTGGHAARACTACHPGSPAPVFSPVPSTVCEDCHAPRHGPGLQCADCHTVAGGFGTFSFDHSSTGFVLLGPHAVLGCNDRCHPSLIFSPPPNTTCDTCH